MNAERLKLRDWLDQERLAERLQACGLSAQGATSKAGLFVQAAGLLRADGVPADAETVGCFCPGRLEVLGKHTDYAGGRSLIAAPELGVAMILCAGESGRLRGHSQQTKGACQFEFDDRSSPLPSGWSLYPATAVRRLAHNFPGVELGAHMACASDLPLAAGMSSSSALITATFLCLTRFFGLDSRSSFQECTPHPTDLAMFASCVENGQSFGPFEGDHGVGTFGGSEDHTAMLCARQNHLGQYGFCPILLEREIRLPEHLTFVLVQSGVTAEKTAGAQGAYNRLALLVRELSAIAHTDLALPESCISLVACLRHDPENGTRLAHAIQKPGRSLRHPASDLLKRLQHLRLESEELIPRWPAPWTQADGPLIRELAQRSTAAARDLLGNQVPETLWLTEALLQAGAQAASPFGAGFGGSVWALVPQTSMETMLDRLRTQKAPTQALQAALLETQAPALGPGAIQL